jgi:polyisoprenoid-binding protein YceI
MTVALLAVATLLLVEAPARAIAEEVAPGVIAFDCHIRTVGSSGGTFRRWCITRAHIDEAHPERSEVDVEVDLASLDTGIGERDRHLRGESFLDVEHYPTAVARLRNFRLDDPDHATADVTLDLHGRSATFPMTFAITDRGARRIHGEATLRRLDFDVGPQLGWRNPMGIVNDVQLSVETVVPPGS